MKNMKKIILFALVLSMGVFTVSNINAQTEKSNIKSLSQSNFNSSIKTGLVLVDFYADWCRPCHMMKPILEEVATEYKSKITIASVNTDNNQTLSTQYGISGIPCMILFKNGKEVLRIIGYNDKAQLLAKLADYL